MRLVFESTNDGSVFQESNVYSECECCGHKRLIAHFTGPDHSANAQAFLMAKHKEERGTA